MTSLTDKLRALGVQTGAKEIIKPKTRNQFSIDKVLNGKFVETPYGEIFVVENIFPIEYRLGHLPIKLTSDMDILSSWTGLNNLKLLSPESFVFIDTETTGLSGGTGTYAFLIGIGQYIAKEFRIMQVFLSEPFEEPAQLSVVDQYLSNAHAIVSFNGKAFDLPLLISRYTLHNQYHPFQNMAHIDLLHLARRLWRDRIQNRMLSNLEYQILGTSRTEEDIPGWMVPSIYFDFLRDSDARPLKRVFYHNLMDVLSLTALLNYISGMLSKSMRIKEFHKSDLIAIAGILEDIGDLESAIHLYNHALNPANHSDSLLDTHTILKATDRLARIYKHEQNYLNAIELWKQAANLLQISPCVELAKYYEHQQKDFSEAIYWTRFALEILDKKMKPSETDSFTSRFDRDLCRQDLEHRLERLSRKALKNL